MQGRDVLKRHVCLCTSQASVNFCLNDGRVLASALCSHTVHHVFILYLLIVGATKVLDTHLFLGTS